MDKNMNVQQAAKVLADELRKHGDLYKSFCLSILSAINENTSRYDDADDAVQLDGVDEYGLSEKILKRIIGEE